VRLVFERYGCSLQVATPTLFGVHRGGETALPSPFQGEGSATSPFQGEGRVGVVQGKVGASGPQSGAGVPLSRPRIRPLLAAALIAAGLLASGCGSSSSKAPMDPSWPSEVQAAPVVVRQAYAFAHEHPDVLRGIPCYCGCGAIGHTSNYACYVAGDDADGGITYDLHALGCSICVDITRDARRMLEEGRSISEIRAAIDSTYSRYGPSNMP